MTPFERDKRCAPRRRRRRLRLPRLLHLRMFLETSLFFLTGNNIHSTCLRARLPRAKGNKAPESYERLDPLQREGAAHGRANRTVVQKSDLCSHNGLATRSPTNRSDDRARARVLRMLPGRWGYSPILHGISLTNITLTEKTGHPEDESRVCCQQQFNLSLCCDCCGLRCAIRGICSGRTATPPRPSPLRRLGSISDFSNQRFDRGRVQSVAFLRNNSSL